MQRLYNIFPDLLKSDLHIEDDLRERRCAQANHLCRKAGGARRDRTADLLLAKQALSQLSYGPVSWSADRWTRLEYGGSGKS